MNKLKNPILNKILFPNVIFIIISIIISGVSLAFVFIKGYDNHVIGYVSFAYSFYTLTVACLYSIFILPKSIKKIKAAVYANKFGNKFFGDQIFRTKVLLNFSLTINLFYVLLNLYFAYYNFSYWFCVLSGYYLILAVMRSVLLRYTLKNELQSDLKSEWKITRFCAVILALINLILSSAVLMILFRDKGFAYNGLLIYVVALYTFYITIQASVNIVKHRKFNSPVFSTAKVVSLTSAMISMLSLETAMLSQFGADMPARDKNILISVTGGVISIIIIAMSVYMIIKANKNIKIKKEG